MINVTVPAMTCNHCVMTITKAVKQVDPDANLQFSLSNHTVAVETDLDPSRLKQVIENTGYDVASFVSTGATEKSTCCGSCAA